MNIAYDINDIYQITEDFEKHLKYKQLLESFRREQGWTIEQMKTKDQLATIDRRCCLEKGYQSQIKESSIQKSSNSSRDNFHDLDLQIINKTHDFLVILSPSSISSLYASSPYSKVNDYSLIFSQNTVSSHQGHNVHMFI